MDNVNVRTREIPHRRIGNALAAFLSPEKSFLLAGGILALGLVYSLLLKVDVSTDLWFYLVVGRETLARGAIPDSEFYIFTVLGAPAHFTGWGFGVVFHLVHELSGFAGMAILNAVLGAGGLCFAALAARQGRGWSWLVAATLALAAAWFLYHERIYYRPEIVFYFLLGIELWLLERWLARRDYRLLLPLPLLAWLLAQMHTTVVFLIAVLGAYVLQYLWQRRGDERLFREAARLALVIAATALLPALNPYGFEQLLVPLKSFLQPAFYANNLEFFPVWETPYRTRYLFAVAVGLLALVLAPRRRPLDWLLVAVFAWFAWRYHRNLALFSLMLVPVVTRALEHWLDRARVRLWPVVAAACGIGLMTTAVAAVAYSVAADGTRGADIRPDALPARATMILRHALPAGGNVMNFYHLGGYLAWALGPGYTVGMDGHFVRPERALAIHHQLIGDRGGSGAMLLDQYRVAAVVSSGTLPYSGMLIPLVERLADDPGWALVAVEPKAPAMTFLRAGLLAPPLHALDKRQIWQLVAFEARNALQGSPSDRSYALLALAKAGYRLGERAAAAAALAEYLPLRPDDAGARQMAEELAQADRMLP